MAKQWELLALLREDSPGEWSETEDKTHTSEEDRDSVGQSCHTEKDRGREVITSALPSTLDAKKWPHTGHPESSHDHTLITKWAGGLCHMQMWDTDREDTQYWSRRGFSDGWQEIEIFEREGERARVFAFGPEHVDAHPHTLPQPLALVALYQSTSP